ncbi:linear gramicidin synthase subunit D [bacterium BMS3Abin10]|nr:linear gramicidin synthase subunit D [bacterium BMS3Abin10]GBE37521.1 linear gramicidin synthase subunit D [bacterium BMS3Bbin08]
MKKQKIEISRKQSNKLGLSKTQDQHQKIAITATFTAEPIEAPLEFWMQQLDIPCRINFAPYSQVFQQLLDPTSLVSTNKNGINIILVRFEDWLQKKEASTENFFTSEIQKKLKDNVKNFITALKSSKERKSTPHIVSICPASPVTDPDLIELHKQMEDLLSTELDAISGVYLVTVTELLTTYPVKEYYDPHGDKIGHIPYTPAFFTSLATMLARKIYNIKSTSYKVIVLDCDYTLWKGVCGEDGPLGIEVDGPWKILQEFILKQHDSGMLICICSKNNEEDVVEVFKHHIEMPLKRDHIVAWRINWNPKSENIKSLAEELKLGLDSFIFIDDNPVECAEIQANCPEVLAILLPNQVNNIPGFLAHMWAFDHLKITEEDHRRTTLYQQNIKRERFRQESLTLADFLQNLELEVKISEMKQQQIPRVAQLIQRTNQFNFTNIRRSEAEIQNLCQSDKLECLVTIVSDRFGDYGLVGVILFKTNFEVIEIDTCLLSCRVLGKGIEHRMLAKLGEIAEERGLKYVEVCYVPSGKNQPAINFLHEVGSKYKKQNDNEFLFRLPSEYATKIIHAKQTETQKQHDKIEKKMNFPQISKEKIIFGQTRTERMNYIATNLFSVESIQKAIKSLYCKQRPDLPNEYVAPNSELEQSIASVWQRGLCVEKVGIHDNFFEIGGQSLTAIQIVSQLCEIFSLELSMHNLFEAPTVFEFAEYVRINQEQENGNIEKIKRMLKKIDQLNDKEAKMLLTKMKNISKKLAVK